MSSVFGDNGARRQASSTNAANVNLLRLRDAGTAKWRALSPRERLIVSVALGIVALVLLWLVAIAPALRTLRTAPVTLDRVDAQLAQMQRLAVEARELKTGTPVGAAQSAAALKAATDRLGASGRLAVVGDRATLTLNGVSGEALRQWLAEARSGARARPVEAQMTRGPRGYTGTLVVSLGGAS
jgi:general secretion pathway protein M